MIKMPRLLDKQLHEVGIVRPSALQLTLKADDVSTASMTLLRDDMPVHLGDWVRIYTPNGDDDVYCVRNIDTDTVTGTRTIELEHAFGMLMDIVVPGEIMPINMGGSSAVISVQKVIAYMLSRQPDGEQWWSLGDCDFDEQQGWSFNDSTIYQALQTLTKSLQGWAWEFDMHAMPFVASLVRRSDKASCEMRMNRNISTMTMTLDKSGMMTRIYPYGADDMQLARPGYVEKNTDVWGVISKVKRESSINTLKDLQKWANDQLDVLSVPRVSIRISGLELSAATGEPLDHLVPGTICRVPLPEYHTVVEERIVSLAWGDMIADPMAVTVTMANNQDLLTKAILQLNSDAESEMQETKTKAEKAAKEAKDKADEADKKASSASQAITTLEATRITDLETATAKLEVTADAITSVVQKYQYDNAGDMLDAWGTRIQQAATGVEISAVWAGIDANTGRIASAESLISVQAGQIALMVKQDEVSSYINLSGDGVTISGGTITLNGKVVMQALEADINTLISNQLHGSTLTVNQLDASEGNIDELSVGSINGTNYYKSRLTIGNKYCEFFAPADATFEWSDVKEVQDAIDAAWNDGFDYCGVDTVSVRDETYHSGSQTISASAYVTTDNGYTSSHSITVDASAAYNDGYNACGVDDVSVRDIAFDKSSTEITATAYVRTDNGYTSGHSIRIDASSAYNAVTADVWEEIITNNRRRVHVMLSNGAEYGITVLFA